MQAWVEAFSVKASMFGWAITISNAPWLFYYRFGNWCASHSVGISSIVGDASAVSPVIAGIAIGIPGTLARVNTLLVLASLCVWAIWVPLALVWPAIIVRISQMVLYARADSPVVSRLADSVLPTLLIEARVLAFTIKACFSQRTFIVISTTGLAADLVGVANEASPAATSSSVAIHLAHSIHAACQCRARVLALFLDAGKVIRAFRISRAFGSWRADARCFGIAHVTVGARADHVVAHHLTVGRGGARVVLRARVDARSVSAGVVLWAVVFRLAADRHRRCKGGCDVSALLLRPAGVAGRARADGVMHGGLAQRVGAAPHHEARVHAAARVAHLGRAALGV